MSCLSQICLKSHVRSCMAGMLKRSVSIMILCADRPRLSKFQVLYFYIKIHFISTHGLLDSWLKLTMKLLGKVLCKTNDNWCFSLKKLGLYQWLRMTLVLTRYKCVLKLRKEAIVEDILWNSLNLKSEILLSLCHQ